MTTWTVPGRITRVIDGDTLVADLDLGWGVWRVGTHIRLAGVNCPELSVPAGVEARAWVIEMLHAFGNAAEFAPVTVVSHSLDKYGRVLADISFSRPVGDGTEHIHLNTALLAAGHAVVMR